MEWLYLEPSSQWIKIAFPSSCSGSCRISFCVYNWMHWYFFSRLTNVTPCVQFLQNVFFCHEESISVTLCLASQNWSLVSHRVLFFFKSICIVFLITSVWLWRYAERLLLDVNCKLLRFLPLHTCWWNGRGKWYRLLRVWNLSSSKIDLRGTIRSTSLGSFHMWNVIRFPLYTQTQVSANGTGD